MSLKVIAFFPLLKKHNSFMCILLTTLHQKILFDGYSSSLAEEEAALIAKKKKGKSEFNL